VQAFFSNDDSIDSRASIAMADKPEMIRLDPLPFTTPPEKNWIPEECLQAAKRVLDLDRSATSETVIWTEKASPDDPDGKPYYEGARKWTLLSYDKAQCEGPNEDLSSWLYARFADYGVVGTRAITKQGLREVEEFMKTFERKDFLYFNGEWTNYFMMGLKGHIRDRDLNTRTEKTFLVDFRWVIRVHEQASQEAKGASQGTEEPSEGK